MPIGGVSVVALSSSRESPTATSVDPVAATASISAPLNVPPVFGIRCQWALSGEDQTTPSTLPEGSGASSPTRTEPLDQGTPPKTYWLPGPEKGAGSLAAHVIEVQVDAGETFGVGLSLSEPSDPSVWISVDALEAMPSLGSELAVQPASRTAVKHVAAATRDKWVEWGDGRADRTIILFESGRAPKSRLVGPIAARSTQLEGRPASSRTNNSSCRPLGRV